MRHHRECDMAMPTVPVAHFIVIQIGPDLGLLDRLLNRAARGTTCARFSRGVSAGALDR